MDVIEIDVVHLQNGQHSIDHWRGSAGISVDNAAQPVSTQMALDDLVHETDLAAPMIARRGVRQRRNEFEVRQSRRDRGDLVQHEQIRPRPRAIEEADWPLLAALDMIGKDRPKRRHSGAAANQQQRARAPLTPKTGSVGPLGFEQGAWFQIAVKLRRKRSGGVLLDDEGKMCPLGWRIGHRESAGDARAGDRQVYILSRPEFQRLVEINLQYANIGCQGRDLGQARFVLPHWDCASQQVFVEIEQLNLKVAIGVSLTEKDMLGLSFIVGQSESRIFEQFDIAAYQS